MVVDESPAAVAVRDFINTLNIEQKRDAIATPAGLHDWLSSHGLLPDGATVRAADVRLAQELREGLRAALLGHDDPDPARPPAALADVSRRLPLVLDFSQDPPGFRPVDDHVRGGIARVLGLVATSAREGSWDRLKVCPADDCRWAFVDTSRNRSRTWCAMGVCGNRQKTRAYRARHRDSA